jgi:hypothetical protein
MYLIFKKLLGILFFIHAFAIYTIFNANHDDSLFYQLVFEKNGAIVFTYAPFIVNSSKESCIVIQTIGINSLYGITFAPSGKTTSNHIYINAIEGLSLDNFSSFANLSLSDTFIGNTDNNIYLAGKNIILNEQSNTPSHIKIGNKNCTVTLHGDIYLGDSNNITTDENNITVLMLNNNKLEKMPFSLFCKEKKLTENTKINTYMNTLNTQNKIIMEKIEQLRKELLYSIQNKNQYNETSLQYALSLYSILQLLLEKNNTLEELLYSLIN